ncbi:MULTISPECIES: sigma-E factor negative regulatory protein [Rhodanobacter]|uniref:sigma-E factor negative regulatory protein n=1 Tax=Rhodanobacter TaxID=75309 RepID=UPI00042327A3|nr:MULTISPECIES: sigma-E factor negative regulatory protein [Rhodanobacter]TAN16950.1 MAG: anti-anti-sigma factor [Rhodanobacter sp.]UJJ53702.1 sigma-E factor negative regulatory protein [Rhodanobacter thiooxydans]
MNQAGTNQDSRESLSAGIDGELPKEQLRFLLRRLDHDTSLQQAWGRYHVARDSLRRQLPPLAGAGFAARVMLVIEQESTPAATSARRNHWLRWSTGGAIAASVAAVALMIGQPTGDAERLTASTTQQETSTVAAAPASKPTTSPAAVPPWLSGNSAGLLSQQASATLGAPFGQSQPVYARRLSGYPSMARYRMLDNNDGSYLLLLDPERQAAPDRSRRASAVAQ